MPVVRSELISSRDRLRRLQAVIAERRNMVIANRIRRLDTIMSNTVQ